MFIDGLLAKYISSLAHHYWLTDFLLSLSARFLPWVMIIGLIYLSLTINNWKERFSFFSLVAISGFLSLGVVNQAIKYLYSRPSPADSIEGITRLINNSPATFPSDHLTLLSVLSLSLYFYRPKWGLVLGGLSLLVGFSRIATGIHWPSDILAGIFIGCLTVLAVREFIPKKSDLNK